MNPMIPAIKYTNDDLWRIGTSSFASALDIYIAFDTSYDLYIE